MEHESSIRATDDSNRPLVILLHASVGSGHRSAAQAIAQAMELLKGAHSQLPANTEIAVLDILDFGKVRFSGEKTASLFTGIMSPIYDFTWHYSLTGRLLWAGGSGWSPLMYKPFTRLVERRKPIAIIATHIVAANCAVAARMETGQSFPVICVPTDYGVEGLWPHLDADLFCVADELMVEELKPRKVPASHIELTGIPVRPGFDAPHDIPTIRADFHVPENKLFTLVMAGAKSSEPYYPFRRTIEPLLDLLATFEDMHFLFLVGEDSEYGTYLQERFNSHGISNAAVLGYTERMVELLSAADLIVAKSGGLAVTECICARLPIVLVGKSYGQERANTFTVTQLGAALAAETSQDVIDTLQLIHQQPALLKEMQEKGASLRRPHSARDVALATLERVGKVTPPKKHFLKVYWGGKPLRVR